MPYGAHPVSAGTLTIGGGEIDGGIDLMPMMGDIYSYPEIAPGYQPATFFMPGDTLTVSASGGVVSAFTAAAATASYAGRCVAAAVAPS